MNELDQIRPILGDKKILVFIGIGAFCAGILIGFKLAGGEKVQLDKNPIQLVSEPIHEPETQETEAEND
jgi:hypothetical protein